MPKEYKYDFSGMVTPDKINGRLAAMSIDGHGHITSYLVVRGGRKYYGRYDYQQAKYKEERT